MNLRSDYNSNDHSKADDEDRDEDSSKTVGLTTEEINLARYNI